jgi:nucleotide-binding universal stress UspA family protein
MYETILVPTDGSAGATAAADHALDLAATHGATVHVLFVADVEMSPITADMDRAEVIDLVEQADHHPTAAIADRAAETDVTVVQAIRHGVVHEVIDEYVGEHDVDVVVMGTHGRAGLDHALLGSVTERVLRTVDVPVLAVHVDEEDS